MQIVLERLYRSVFCLSFTMLVVFSCNEILERGLLLVGIDDTSTVCRDTNLERFRSHFGSNLIVYTQIWEDRQTTENEEAKISGASLEGRKGKSAPLPAILPSFHSLPSCFCLSFFCFRLFGPKTGCPETTIKWHKMFPVGRQKIGCRRQGIPRGARDHQLRFESSKVRQEPAIKLSMVVSIFLLSI
jgi:hypothetical protein